MMMVSSWFAAKRASLVTLGFVAVQFISHTVHAAHGLDDTTSQAQAASEPDPRKYDLALGASFSVGDAGWGTELGNMTQLYGRYQLYRGFGVGASYFWLTAPNNEGNAWPEFHGQALEGFAEYHPLPTSWFDPFARAGVLGFTHVEGIEAADQIGLQGMVGVDFVLPHVAIGVHARSGFVNRTWTLFGLHTEVRF
ncbi:MAG: hypothetical protein ABIQ16_21575 [Polyangiaceae bacterium]